MVPSARPSPQLLIDHGCLSLAGAQLLASFLLCQSFSGTEAQKVSSHLSDCFQQSADTPPFLLKGAWLGLKPEEGDGQLQGHSSTEGLRWTGCGWLCRPQGRGRWGPTATV